MESSQASIDILYHLNLRPFSVFSLMIYKTQQDEISPLEILSLSLGADCLIPLPPGYYPLRTSII